MASPKLCPRGSVGAIIKKDGAYVMLYRKLGSKGLAGIAGHIDPGESPEQALVREVREESGIEVEGYSLVLHETFHNPCKLGFDAHEWWVYEVTRWQGEPKLQEAEKHTFVRFMSPDEIRPYLQKEDADPAWSKCIFPKLGLMNS